VRRTGIYAALLVCMVAAAPALHVRAQSMVIPPADLVPPPWPAWVLQHWVWEHEMFTADSAIGLVGEYLQRDIPVGATIIDSRWETGYNTFEFNLERYPDPQALVDALHALGIRVFLWITSMINVETPQSHSERQGWGSSASRHTARLGIRARRAIGVTASDQPKSTAAPPRAGGGRLTALHGDGWRGRLRVLTPPIATRPRDWWGDGPPLVPIPCIT
jgi:hypothetical protein